MAREDQDHADPPLRTRARDVNPDRAVFCTSRHAAAVIGVHRRTIVRWVDGGQLEGKRIGARVYVRRDALAELVARRVNDAVSAASDD